MNLYIFGIYTEHRHIESENLSHRIKNLSLFLPPVPVSYEAPNRAMLRIGVFR